MLPSFGPWMSKESGLAASFRTEGITRQSAVCVHVPAPLVETRSGSTVCRTVSVEPLSDWTSPKMPLQQPSGYARARTAFSREAHHLPHWAYSRRFLRLGFPLGFGCKARPHLLTRWPWRRVTADGSWPSADRITTRRGGVAGYCRTVYNCAEPVPRMLAMRHR